MEVIIAACVIALVSFVLALRSMKELEYGDQLHKKNIQKRSKGRITFYKDTIVHSTTLKKNQ